MARYTLYGFNGSTYVRTIRMLLIEKGIEYDQVSVNVLTGEPRGDTHRQRHPFGKVPTIEADGISLFETAAIAELIEGENPDTPRFIPEDVVERARMRQWMGAIDAYTYPAIIGTIVWQRVVNPAIGEATDEAACHDAVPTARYHLGVYDRALGETTYLASNELTLADLYLAPIMAYLSMTPEGEQLLAECPNLTRWWDAIQTRSSFQQTPPA
jgi:glutathione S-transferase